MTSDVRCAKKLHARLVPNPQEPQGKLLEIRCDSRLCKGFASGSVVLHYFSPLTGELLETKRFKEV